jgi:hypothetical protein
VDGDIVATIDPNIGVKSGGTTVRTYGLRKRIIVKSFIIYRDIQIGMSTIRQVADRIAIPVRQDWVPVNQHLEEAFVPDQRENKAAQRLVGGITLTPKDADISDTFLLPRYPYKGLVGWDTSLLPTVKTSGYVQDVIKANGFERLSEMLRTGRYSLDTINETVRDASPIGVDLNRLNFPELELDDPCAYEFNAPPGTIWVPDTPGYQVMTTGSNFMMERAFNSNLYASTQIRGFDARTMFSMCLNKDLKEPDGKVRYFGYQCSDPVLQALARITDQSRFKGPRDQARLWIYTDKATLEKLNERLLPRISLGRYTQSLFEVVFFGGFTPEQIVKNGMLKADALDEEDLSQQAALWGFWILDRHNPEGLATWIKSSRATVEMALAGDDAIKQKTIALVKAALDSNQISVNEAMILQLAAISDVSALKDKLGKFRSGLYSANGEVQAKSLELVAKLSSELPKDALEFLAASGATPEIQARAKELMAGY